MSFNVEPDNLYKEFEAARKYWLAGSQLASELSKKCAGEAYSGRTKDVATPENYVYTHTLHTTARLTSGTQRPRYTTKKRDMSARVEEHEEFGRRWARDTRWDAEFERCVQDMCNGGAVALVAQRARRGYEHFQDPPQTPSATRIPGHLWGCDPLATSFETIRYAFHLCIEYHPDIVAVAEQDKSWNLEAVRAMVKEPMSNARNVPRYGVNRDEVTYVVMWVPGHRLPESDPVWQEMAPELREKCHGTIFTFGLCSKPAWLGLATKESPEYLRKPRPYFGPRQGPYVYGGFLNVPNEVRTTAPLIANLGQIEQLNAQVRSNDKIANAAKTGVFVDGMSPDHSVAVQNFEHGEWVQVPGLDKQRFEIVTIPGITADARARELELGARVRRNLMMPDTALGEASGAATLGENQIADSHLSMVTAYMDRKALDFSAQVFLRVAYWVENDARTVVAHDGGIMIGGRTREDMRNGIGRLRRVNMIDEAEMADMLAMLPEEDGAPVSFDDLDITVERVRQDNESLQKFTAATGFMMQVAELATTGIAPGLQALLDRAADEYGVAEIAQVFDLEAAAEVAAKANEPKPEPRTVAPPEFKPRTTGAPTAKGRTPANKPEAQAAKLRSKSA